MHEVQSILGKICYCAYVNKNVRLYTFSLCKILSAYDGIKANNKIPLNNKIGRTVKFELLKCRKAIIKNPKVKFCILLDKRDRNTVEIFTDASFFAIEMFSPDIGKNESFFYVKNDVFGVLAAEKSSEK